MILGATITGSLTLNGVNLASITGSEASINALNLFTASAATTGSNVFKSNQTVTGSVDITGSLTVVGPITGTVTTASYVLNAVSASYALNATTSSYALNATTASYALASTSASYALNATTASFALVATTASYAANADLLDGRDSLTFANTGSNAFVGTQNINGDVAITGSLTTTGAITAQTLNVQQVTSSIVYSSGSNIFGNSVSNMQSMTGSVGISGSLAVVGASTITGVLTLNSTITNGTYTYTLPSATGTIALTSALSSYLPLAGGTLTGALSGTSATFSGTITSTITNNLVLSNNTSTTQYVYCSMANSVGNARYGVDNSSGGGLGTNTSANSAVFGNAGNADVDITTNNISRLKIASTGAATFSGSVGVGSSTSNYAQFAIYGGNDNQMAIGTTTTGQTAGVFFSDGVANNTNFKWEFGKDTSNDFFIYSYGTASKIATWNYATGAATFSSTVSVGSRLALQPSYFGYSSTYKTLLIGGVGTDYTTNAVTLAFNVDVTANPGGSFGGNGTEYIWRNAGSFKTPNAANTEYNTLLSWNSSGQLTVAGAATFSSSVTTGGTITSSISSGNNFQADKPTGAGIAISGATGTTNYVILQGTNSTNPDLQIYTGGSERMRITSGGFLKASNTGTYSSSSGTFHELISNVAATQTVTIKNNHASNPYGIFMSFDNAAPNNGTNYYIYGQDSGVPRFAIYSNGGLSNYSANNVNLSDERAKKDIVPMESQWDIFKNIEFSKFKYKDQTHDDFNYGVIAQQVLNVAPHFVNTDGFADTDMLSVYDTDIHYSAHKALQECMFKIEELKTEIDLLKGIAPIEPTDNNLE